MTTPLLSVVIPTWNRAHLVGDAIESALSQRAGQVEVIVVDDGSTDDTADVLARSFGSYIRLLRNPHRRGVGASRNAGARLASGKLIAFLDSDDLWLPGKLDAELRALERFPTAEAVVSDSLNFLEGEAEEQSRFALNGLLAASQGQVRWMNECRWLWTNSQNGVATCSITLRREALSRLGETLFAEDIICCEDWEFEMRVYHLCRVVVLPEVWARVRRFDDGARLPGRARPGKPPTREQEIGLLRDRLKVMERSGWLSGLDAHLAVELDRYRGDTARQLARLSKEVVVMEVHLWRGSAEQRALRSQFRKSGQFAYFNEQLDYPDWAGKAVLDFGGNAGNLLLNEDCPIRPENYYCMDVLREAIEEGRKKFPHAHLVHYNRYNCSFNPEGIEDLPLPDMGIEFDMILAYSVFTHTTREEMNDLVEQLRARLAPGGALVFTFIDPHFQSWPETYEGNNLKWRLEHFHKTNPAVDVNGLLEQSRGAEWCALVDGSQLFVNGNGVWENEAQSCMTYDVYYTVEFLRREFPSATIRPPVNGEMQHCCIIRARDVI